MKEYLKSLEKEIILNSLAYIAIGIVLLAFPGITIRLVSYIIAIGLVVVGIVDLVIYFIHINTPVYQRKFIEGVMSIIIAVFIYFKYQLLASIIPVLMGIFILFTAVDKMEKSIQLKHYENNWLLLLILASLEAIFGLVILLNPFKSFESLVMLIGSAFIVTGICNLISSAYFKKQMNDKIIDI